MRRRHRHGGPAVDAPPISARRVWHDGASKLRPDDRRMPLGPSGWTRTGESAEIGVAASCGPARAWFCRRGGLGRRAMETGKAGAAGMAKGAKGAGEAAENTDPILSLVGARIRAIRKRAKIKQSVLAEAIGTHPSYIVGVESGAQNMTLKTLARIASALGVPPMTLLLEGELAVSVDEGKLDQFEKILRAVAQHSAKHSEEVAELLGRALEMISVRTNHPDFAGTAKTAPTGTGESGF